MIIDQIIALLGRLVGLGRAEAVSPVERDADGAVVNRGKVSVNASPEKVYRLLDPSRDANRWTQRGDRIEAVDAANGLYRLIDQRMPDEPFLIQVDAARPFAAITTTTVGDGGAPVGAIAKSTSRYEIEPAPQGCVVSLIECSIFLDGLNARDVAQHAVMIGRGVKTDLARLKDEAEESSDDRVAARA